jgi:hypothetical protein
MGSNYMKSGPMFFTSIDQIIEWVSNTGFTSNELLAALQETKKEGFEIQKVKELTPNDFVRVDQDEWEHSICEGCYFNNENMLLCVDEKRGLAQIVMDELGDCSGHIFKLKS